MRWKALAKWTVYSINIDSNNAHQWHKTMSFPDKMTPTLHADKAKPSVIIIWSYFSRSLPHGVKWSVIVTKVFAIFTLHLDMFPLIHSLHHSQFILCSSSEGVPEAVDPRLENPISSCACLFCILFLSDLLRDPVFLLLRLNEDSSCVE